jgi:hypothetical protein
MRPGMQFLFTGFVVVVVFLITQFIGALLAIPLFGFEKVAGMVTGIDFSDPESMNLLKYLQVFQSIGLFIIPSTGCRLAVSRKLGKLPVPRQKTSLAGRFACNCNDLYCKPFYKLYRCYKC